MNPDLSQLRDIHTPDTVSWWPIADGWLLLFKLIVVLILLGCFLYRRKQAQSWRKVALAELESIRQQPDSLQQVQAISALLRRVAVTCYPRYKVASLTGEAWLRFLDSGLKEARFQKQATILVSAPYTRGDVDVQPLFELSEVWIKSVRRQG